MSTQTENSNMKVSRRLDKTLPSKFLGEELDSRILTVFARAFQEILEKAQTDSRTWDSRIASFRTHRLLEISVPKELTIGRIEIDIPARRGAEASKIVRDFDKPIAFGFDRHVLVIDRSRVSEGDYLEEVASILAYMFIWRMVESGDAGLMFASSGDRLLFLDNLRSSDLAEFLDRFHQGQSKASQFANFLLSKSMDASVSASDIFKGFDELGERLREQFRESFEAFSPQFEASIEEAVRKARQELDVVSAKAREVTGLRCDCSESSCECSVASEKRILEKSESGSKSRTCDVVDVLLIHSDHCGHHSIEELANRNIERQNFLNRQKN